VFATVVAPLLGRLSPRALSRVLPASRRPLRPDIAEIVADVERGIIVRSSRLTTDCRIRGVTRYVFLRRAGLPVELVFGLAAGKPGVPGHCWLVHDGQPLLEPEAVEEFTPVFRIPAA
jgi:Transglutaminase-like superfamily